jgi:hypothetical protein
MRKTSRSRSSGRGMSKCQMAREKVLRYARYPDVDAYLKQGWIYRPGLEGCHHGEWSVILEWLCECPVPGSSNSERSSTQTHSSLSLQTEEPASVA